MTMCAATKRAFTARLVAGAVVIALFACDGDGDGIEAPAGDCAHEFLPLPAWADGDGGADHGGDEDGSVPLPDNKLVAHDGDDSFGKAVSISDDTVIVGAHGKSASGSHAGAAYVFVRHGMSWIEQAKLTASDASCGDFFGWAVSVSGDTAVVGAYLRAHDKGAAYVFVRNGSTWTEQQMLTASDGRSGDKFGFSVSLSGDTAVVGAVGDRNPIRSAAYVFVRKGTRWTEQQKLTGDRGSGSSFGWEVAVSSDRTIVGAPGLDEPRWAAGAAYVFARHGANWAQEQKLVAPGDGDFGWSVGLAGDSAIVGARGSIDEAHSGAAYLFARGGSTWTLQQKLVAREPGRFGVSVAVAEGTAITGAPSDGAAYVFVRNGSAWTEHEKLTASDGARFGLGFSASISGATAVLGALPVSDQYRVGAAYVFDVPSGAP